jgi:phosphatidylglycerophosphate synthase
MLDQPIRKILDPILEAIADRMARLGLTANSITIVGFVIGMAGCAAIVGKQHSLALTLIVLNRLADGLDGAVARRLGATDRGGYLDIVLDMLWYSAVPFAFALSDAALALPAAFLIYSFIGTGASFLAFAILAAKRQVPTPAKKSFFYSVGLMEGTETILFFIAFCLWPEQFAVLAWVFGGLCWVTTLLRIITSMTVFRDPPHEPIR